MQRKRRSGIFFPNAKIHDMKTNRITLIAFAALASVAVSCKKVKPSDPINKDLPNAPECSFCPGETLSMDPATGLVNDSYAQQVSFFHPNNQENTPVAPGRTANGFYDYHEGMAISFNLANLPLACVSNKITFAHARSVSNTNDNPRLVNVKFPTTPLIVCNADELGQQLAPYGYAVEYHSVPGTVHQDLIASFAGVVDSLIITGPGFETVTIGANLFESELRSICISHQ